MSQQCRVLIADDVPALRALLRLLFRGDPSVEIVAEAADGQEAVQLAQQHQPDVVLLDIAMPVMDGLEAARSIRRLLPHVKIVMLSGFSADSMKAEALRCGADDYIEKGHEPSRILEQLQNVCLKPEPSTPK